MMERRSSPQRRDPGQDAWPVPARRHVLLAEDDLQARAILAEALRQDGYRVSEVGDGHQLLEALGGALLGRALDDPIDVVIADIRMPGPSGLAVLRSVRGASLALPFILVTGFGDEETHADADRLGAMAVFDKPFDIDDLRTFVLNRVPAR